ncbi:protein Skeletor, isoforms D/E-like [Cylas formicarius]|uniref:protein Skeletor, isoforms D/E-like n=1 Tax=Cylas formicarius TaxID=197179 RepID=UPI0029589718|nr:protein Skeletor, isoforms D/E-like [Cylas formicarius]
MQSHISRVAPPNFRPSPTLEVSLEELHAFGTFSTTTPPQRVAQGYIIAPPLHSKPFQNKPLFHTHAPVRPSPPRRHLSSNPAKQPYFKATHPTRYVKPHNTKPLPKVIALNPVTKSPPIILSSPRTAGVSETDLLVKDIEISPIQASTEREPNVPAPSYLLSISNSSADVLRLPLAKNSGFKPETIVIESGFKPIIGKVIENRNDNDRIDLELNPEGQTGIIATKGKKVIPIDSFEPIFIPSPTDKSSKSPKTSKRPLKKHALKIIFRTRRLVDPNFEPGMAASERTDSYYLPPPGHTEKPKIFDPKQPSNIDVASPSSMELAASPPDVVVTYDGKKVSGASLTAKIFDKSRLFEQTGSKATEFIKARPQFGPFRGELPPLGSDVLFDGKEPYHRTPKAGVLSRELDTPLPPPPGSSSTRLTRVERSAHHNPEHTAQQSVFNNW